MADVQTVLTWWTRIITGRWTATRKATVRRVTRTRARIRHSLRQAIAWLKASRTALLNLAGFGCLAASAWVTFGLGAGLAAIGISSLALELLSNDAEKQR